MYSETITYTDFDDVEQSETLYFNLTKSELAEHLDLIDQVRDVQNVLEGEERELRPEEIRKILNLIKELMRLSYGTREGKRFIKNPEAWTEFTQTAAYDAFIFSLFEHPEKSSIFMTQVLPKDLAEQAKTVVEASEESTDDLSTLSREELLRRIQSNG